MIPRLASPTDLAASGKRSFFKRGAPGEPVGCDPRIFANEVCAYLMRALEVKGAAARAMAEPIAGVQAPVKTTQKPRVTANAPKSQGAPPQGTRPPVAPGRVPPVEVTKQPLVTANTAQWQEAAAHDAQPPVGVKPEPPATTSPSHFSWLQRFAERMGTEHSAEQREEEPRQAAGWSVARQRAGASLSSLASTLGTRLGHLFATDMDAPDDSVKVARPPEQARPTTRRATAPEPPVPVAKPSQRPFGTPPPRRQRPRLRRFAPRSNRGPRRQARARQRAPDRSDGRRWRWRPSEKAWTRGPSQKGCAWRRADSACTESPSQTACPRRPSKKACTWRSLPCKCVSLSSGRGM